MSVATIIGMIVKVLGFAMDWVGAKNESKKALIDLGVKLSEEGLLPTKVNDKMKSKWDKINSQMKEAENGTKD